MTSIRRMFGTVAGLVVLLGGFTAAHAQATRTWVSGVGDDANPCSRTAPCKTFAGAISKTAASGEINVLDPGGFGAVTITKSITISSEGFEAGVLVSGTNGIIVNTPAATDVVVLRGLDIEGNGTGLKGISVLGVGGTVHVEKCTINNFTQGGIGIANTSGTVKLFVKDTILRRNLGASSGGILVTPTAPGAAIASLDNVRMEGNQFGLKVANNANVTVRNSLAAGNATHGFSCETTGATAAVLNLESCVTTNNTMKGVLSSGTAATVVMSNVYISNNGNGISIVAGGAKILSFGNNHNTQDGVPTAPVIPPQ